MLLLKEYKGVNVVSYVVTSYQLKIIITLVLVGTAVAQWLRYCATNQKVDGSIPLGVIGIFH
jgi:hypothetical protein